MLRMCEVDTIFPVLCRRHDSAPDWMAFANNGTPQFAWLVLPCPKLYVRLPLSSLRYAHNFPLYIAMVVSGLQLSFITILKRPKIQRKDER